MAEFDDDQGLDELMESLMQNAEEQLPTPPTSDALPPSPPPPSPPIKANLDGEAQSNATLIIEDDEDIIQLVSSPYEERIEPLKPLSSPPPLPRRDWKQNTREVDPHEDYGGALLSSPERQLLESLRSSSTYDTTSQPKPIVRKPFPPPLPARSPLFGATNAAAVLRTCFRVGEALNVGCQAVRKANHGGGVLIELYARVASSQREGRKQHFVFHDLYHDHAPFLHGVFELWDQSELWDGDSKVFLGREGVMCRVIGRMRRGGAAGGEGDGRQWRLEVLSIWEAGWEDVEAVAGIYARG